MFLLLDVLSYNVWYRLSILPLGLYLGDKLLLFSLLMKLFLDLAKSASDATDLN